MQVMSVMSGFIRGKSMPPTLFILPSFQGLECRCGGGVVGTRVKEKLRRRDQGFGGLHRA